ncbi:MAG: hypothetical protein KBD83_08780 [Gammaproteobacteria bacterium]|nr:hypothetical protein [Gammaproteobacteria bacterium]
MSSIGESLLKGAQEALAYAQGALSTSIVHKVSIPNEIDVLGIRNNLHMSRKNARRANTCISTCDCE